MESTNENRAGWRDVLVLCMFWASVVLYVGGLLAPLATISKHFSAADALQTAKASGTNGLLTDAAELLMEITEENPVLVNETNTYSVLSGARELFNANEIFLAVVIVLFSVLFPCAKLASLFLLCHDGISRSRELHFKAHAFLGKWSMLDVFVIALLVVSLKLGDMVNVQIHCGIYFFAASVLLTMALTQMLHRRQVRDPAGR